VCVVYVRCSAALSASVCRSVINDDIALSIIVGIIVCTRLTAALAHSDDDTIYVYLIRLPVEECSVSRGTAILIRLVNRLDLTCMTKARR